MSRLINPWEQFNSPTAPYAFGTVYFGLPNQDPITNPKAPFSDSALTVPIGESQVLDDKGMFETAIYLSGSYSMSLYDSKGNFIRTEPEARGALSVSDSAIQKATIAAATSDDSLADSIGDYVRVAEYTAGKPIDALYEIVASGTGTDDGGSYHDSDTLNAFQLKLILERIAFPALWGAVYDDSTDDSTAIANMVAFTKTFDLQDKTYYLGTIDDTNTVAIDIQSTDGVNIYSSGATLRVDDGGATGAQQHAIIRMLDCNNTHIHGHLNTVSDVKNQFGPDGIQYVAQNSHSRNHTIESIKGTKGSAVIRQTFASPNTAPYGFRVSNLTALVEHDNCYYGTVNEEEGDNCKIRMKTDVPTRSAIMFGCNDVEMHIESNNHIQSSGDVVISTFYRDTRNIKIHYEAFTNASAEYLVRVSHNATTGANPVTGPTSGKRIENVEIFYDDTGTARSAGGTNNWGITLREEDSAGAVRTTSPHVMTNIKVNGVFTRGFLPDTAVQTPTAFSESGKLWIDQSFFPYESPYLTYSQYLQGSPLNNWMLNRGGERWLTNIIGDLEAAPFNMSAKRGQGPINVQATLSIIQDITKTVGGGGVATLVAEYGVFGSVSSDIYSFLSQTTMSSAAGGGYAPTVTFSGAGADENIVCTLTSANGATPANGRATLELEFLT
jgi:hypothetical protein